jgi:hypothetical protein
MIPQRGLKGEHLKADGALMSHVDLRGDLFLEGMIVRVAKKSSSYVDGKQITNNRTGKVLLEGQKVYQTRKVLPYKSNALIP